MRNRIERIAASLVVLAVALAAGACREYPTHPIYRRPVISSVVAFPTVLGPGDSTMITIYASDPDGDSLVYDWKAYNGLTFPGAYAGVRYNCSSPSMVFRKSPTWNSPYDTAFVWCSVRDGRGGSDTRQVLIVYQD